MARFVFLVLLLLHASPALAVDREPEINVKIIDNEDEISADVNNEFGAKRLQVSAVILDDGGNPIGTINNSLKVVPTLPPNFINDFSDTEVTISNSVFTTLFSFNGPGVLVGFIVEFNASSFQLQFSVDGNSNFDLHMFDELRLMQYVSNETRTTAGGPNVDTSSNHLWYVAKDPIRFETSFVLKAKGDTSGKKMIRRMVNYALDN
jgi:hypothetical protein